MLESKHDYVGRERCRRWSDDTKQMRRFAAEKKKLEAEMFAVTPFSVNGGAEQRRKIHGVVRADRG